MSKKSQENYTNSIFENIKNVDEYGQEYWYARELQKVLEYNGYNMKSNKGTSHRQFINSKRRCNYNKRRKSIKKLYM